MSIIGIKVANKITAKYVGRFCNSFLIAVKKERNTIYLKKLNSLLTPFLFRCQLPFIEKSLANQVIYSENNLSSKSHPKRRHTQESKRRLHSLVFNIRCSTFSLYWLHLLSYNDINTGDIKITFTPVTPQQLMQSFYPTPFKQRCTREQKGLIKMNKWIIKTKLHFNLKWKKKIFFNRKHFSASNSIHNIHHKKKQSSPQ